MGYGGIEMIENDFGFTAVDYSDIEISATKEESYKQELLRAYERLSKIESDFNLYRHAIQPFLENLKKDPEKEYILWKDRKQKIEKFQSELSIFTRAVSETFTRNY
jgi:hypothetical protein